LPRRASSSGIFFGAAPPEISSRWLSRWLSSPRVALQQQLGRRTSSSVAQHCRLSLCPLSDASESAHFLTRGLSDASESPDLHARTCLKSYTRISCSFSWCGH
jgi:hypothetical protein